MLLKNKKVLIVEDDEMMRETLAELISECGAVVTTASNGNSAFDLVKINSFDAVITDVRMPHGDGITLAQNIKTLAIRPLVFVCSGFNDLTVADYNRLNISAVFEKPYNFSMLANAVVTELSKIKSE